MKRSSLILILLFTTIAGAAAQETSKDKPGFPLPEYIIEVQRPDGCVFSPVVPKQKSGFVLYALPRPKDFPADRSGQPITSKIFVSAKQLDEQWEVKVFVGTGEFYDAGDFKVGEYKLNLNQRVTVAEVSRFGLSPIRVGVVRIIRDESSKPRIYSLTQSIAVESVEAKDLPEPYKVKLKNNSPSDLVATQYITYRDDKFLALKWYSPGHLKPFIKPGESYELAIGSEANSCGDADGYRPSQSDRVEFVSAVFADGSYEGQTGLAALIKGTAFGNRQHLERVIETFRFYSEAEPGELVSQLNYLQEGMIEETQPYMAGLLRSMMPSLHPNATSELNGFIRSGMHEVKVNLARDVRYFESMKREKNPALDVLWVKHTKEKYQRWFAAAEKMTSQ